jgi:putative peptidoglycan lipid II flippase
VVGQPHPSHPSGAARRGDDVSSTELEASAASRLVRSSTVVALGTLLSRVTGLVRVGVLAYALGQATLADTYNLANTTPNIVYELLVGGVLSATLVPVFVDHLRRRDERATSAVFTVTMTVLTALTVIAIVLAPQIARLYSLDTSGARREAQLDVMTFLIRCFLPQMLFYGFTALATALLNARRRFAAAAYAPVLNNVVVVCALLAFTRLATGPQENWVDVERIRDDRGLLLLLGLGTTAGIAAMALVLVPALARAGAHLRLVFDWRHEAVRLVVRLSGWTFGYVVANQVALLFVLVLASTGDAGDVSAYQYAFIFFQLPHGLFAVSIMTTITPELARHASAEDRPAMRDDFTLGLRYLLLVVVPSSIALVTLAQPALSVLVRGGFDEQDATVTADVLQGFAIGLVPFSVYLFTLRGFYAQQDTRTPFMVNAVENTINVLLALALFPALGVRGLSLAYSGAYAIAAVIALVLLSRRIGDLLPPPLRATAAKSVLAAAALGLVSAWCAGAIGRDSPAEAALAVGVGATAGGLAYVGTLVAVRSEELRGLARVLRRRGESSVDV